MRTASFLQKKSVPVRVYRSPKISYPLAQDWLLGLAEFAKIRMGQKLVPTTRLYSENLLTESTPLRRAVDDDEYHQEPHWDVILTHEKLAEKVAYSTPKHLCIVSSLKSIKNTNEAHLLGYHVLAQYFSPSCAAKKCVHQRIEDPDFFETLAIQYTLTGAIPLCDVHRDWKLFYT